MHAAAKVLKFPLSGVARDIDYRKAYIPEEEVQFATPFAVNVRGSDTFHRRNRGGSRPGLKAISTITTTSSGRWLWPNGEAILWADGANMTFNESVATITTPDGSKVIDPHAQYSIRGLDVTSPTVATFYRNRVVCAKDSQWYMSAIGDVTDWDFGKPVEDTARAVSGNIALAGKSGEKIVAVMPVRDSALYIATLHSLWMISGDPTNGSIRCLSDHVGCISRDAWCFDGSRLWMVSNQGIYALAVGENIPVKVSSHLPEDFLGVTEALLMYDPEDSAIHIFTTFGTGETAKNADWFYEIDNKAFWNVALPSAHRPVAVAWCMQDGVGVAAFKGTDGTWRYFDNSQTTDDGTDISSKVAIGPIRCSARDDMDGMVAEVEAMLATGSSDVQISIYTAHSPEQAVETAYNAQNPVSTLSAHAGWNNVCRPRIRGAWAVFVVSSTGRWGYESMTAVCKQLGRLR